MEQNDLLGQQLEIMTSARREKAEAYGRDLYQAVVRLSNLDPIVTRPYGKPVLSTRLTKDLTVISGYSRDEYGKLPYYATVIWLQNGQQKTVFRAMHVFDSTPIVFIHIPGDWEAIVINRANEITG